MTSVGPARRLLAELMESEPLSAEPIADVCADLAALGVDPAGVIAVARRLAEGKESPAEALLGRIEESERIDADSRNLLSDDISTVYKQPDGGLAKSTIENARRMARNGSKVVWLRRVKRRLFSILGALAAGVALPFRALSNRTKALHHALETRALEHVLGFRLEHPDVATSLNNLADLYHTQGRSAEAELLHKLALAIQHPDVALILNNLAEHTRDHYAGALLSGFLSGFLSHLSHRYEGIVEVLGSFLPEPEPPDVVTSLNNLANLYYTQGCYAEAELLYKLAQASREKKLRPEHPDVARILNNLAELYYSQGHYAEVESLYKRALAIRQKA